MGYYAYALVYEHDEKYDLAEQEYEALILGNQAANFSVGANLAMAFMLAIEQEYEELEMATRMFQNTVMRLRYSSVPTLITPRGMTFGGTRYVNDFQRPI